MKLSVTWALLIYRKTSGLLYFCVIRFSIGVCQKCTRMFHKKKSLCSWERMTNLILSHLPLIYHERAVIYETKRVETIIFHHLYERRFPFLRKGKISVSTYNILKESLRHLSDQSAFITFRGGVGGWRGFGGIAGGNGREISSCQQIVNSPTEKKNRAKQKKLKRVKGKK